MKTMGVVFRKISKVFAGGAVALDGLDLDFDSGEFLVLLGPSGSGKSTACRILAGLERPSSGTIEVEGQDITYLPPRSRNMSMVFQNYALYPHKSVFENIAYPLRVRKMGRAEIKGAVGAMAEMLKIDALLQRRPRQLSGGEAQRVAVARALVWQPEICLMDEPLSNLDALLRLHTRTEIKRIHHTLQKTFVFVTHDQEEAMSLGTRIAVLASGRLVQFDTPRQIYHQPATRFVAEFIGRPAMNTIEGRVESGVFRAGEFAVEIDDSRAEGPVVLGIRPEEIELRDEPGPDTLTLRLDVMEVVEPDTLLTLEQGTVKIVVRVLHRVRSMERGQAVHVVLPRQALHFFDIESGRRLP
jgi:ABC-type sugar transport system ATPase subunit